MKNSKLSKSFLAILLSLTCLVGCYKATNKTKNLNNDIQDMVNEEISLPIDRSLPLFLAQKDPVSPVSFYGTSLNIDANHIWLAYYLEIAPNNDFDEPNYQNAFIKIYNSEADYESTINQPIKELKFETDGVLVNYDSNSKKSIVAFYMKTLNYENLVDIFYAVPFYKNNDKEITNNQGLEYGMIDYCINKEGDESKYDDKSPINLGQFLKAIIDYASFCQQYFNYKSSHDLLAKNFYDTRKVDKVRKAILALNNNSSRETIDSLFMLYNKLTNEQQQSLESSEELKTKMDEYKGLFINVGSKNNPYVCNLPDTNFNQISVIGTCYIEFENITATTLFLNGNCNLTINNFSIDTITSNDSTTATLTLSGTRTFEDDKDNHDKKNNMRINQMTFTNSDIRIVTYDKDNTGSILNPQLKYKESLVFSDGGNITLDRSFLELIPDTRESISAPEMYFNTVTMNSSTFKLGTNNPYDYHGGIEKFIINGGNNAIELGTVGENKERNVARNEVNSIESNNTIEGNKGLYLSLKGYVHLSTIELSKTTFTCDLKSDAYKISGTIQYYTHPTIGRLYLSECESTINGLDQADTVSEYPLDPFFKSGDYTDTKVSQISMADIFTSGSKVTTFNNIYFSAGLYVLRRKGDSTFLDSPNIILNKCFVYTDASTTIENCYARLNYTRLVQLPIHPQSSVDHYFNFISDKVEITGAREIDNQLVLLENDSPITFDNTNVTINGGIYSGKITCENNSTVTVGNNTYINNEETDVTGWISNYNKIQILNPTNTYYKFIDNSPIGLNKVHEILNILQFDTTQMFTYSDAGNKKTYTYVVDSGKTFESINATKEIYLSYYNELLNAYNGALQNSETNESGTYMKTTIAYQQFDMGLVVSLAKADEPNSNLIATITFEILEK